MKTAKHSDQTGQSIKELQKALQVECVTQDAEKLYKTQIQIRRQSAKPIFQSDDGISGEFDLLAKQELSKVKEQDYLVTETKNKDKEAAILTLNARIERIKANSMLQADFIQAGPQFMRHGLCLFGKVLHFSAISDEQFLVFSTNNTAELWNSPQKGECILERILPVFPNEKITSITEISRNTSKDENKKNQRVDIEEMKVTKRVMDTQEDIALVQKAYTYDGLNTNLPDMITW
jgi:hypothetical protein